MDWSVLFQAAGLEIEQWQATEPRWNPLSHSDARASWEGTLAPFSVPARIDAAAYRGVPVWFDIVLPSARPSRDPDSVPPRTAGTIVGLIVVVLFVLGGVFFA